VRVARAQERRRIRNADIVTTRTSHGDGRRNGTCRDTLPYSRGGSRGAAVACGRRATARRPACNGRDAARVGGRHSRRTCHSPGGKPWRDRCQRSTAASSRCKRATGVTRRGREGGTRDARATRAGGSRGATVASEARPLHRGASVQPGVTRRGWAGSGRTCSRAAGAAERRASIATRSRVMGGLWTEQKIITRHDKLLHQCR